MASTPEELAAELTAAYEQRGLATKARNNLKAVPTVFVRSRLLRIDEPIILKGRAQRLDFDDAIIEPGPNFEQDWPGRFGLETDQTPGDDGFVRVELANFQMAGFPNAIDLTGPNLSSAQAVLYRTSFHDCGVLHFSSQSASITFYNPQFTGCRKIWFDNVDDVKMYGPWFSAFNVRGDDEALIYSDGGLTIFGGISAPGESEGARAGLVRFYTTSAHPENGSRHKSISFYGFRAGGEHGGLSLINAHIPAQDVRLPKHRPCQILVMGGTWTAARDSPCVRLYEGPNLLALRDVVGFQGGGDAVKWSESYDPDLIRQKEASLRQLSHNVHLDIAGNVGGRNQPSANAFPPGLAWAHTGGASIKDHSLDLDLDELARRVADVLAKQNPDQSTIEKSVDEATRKGKNRSRGKRRWR